MTGCRENIEVCPVIIDLGSLKWQELLDWVIHPLIQFTAAQAINSVKQSNA